MQTNFLILGGGCDGLDTAIELRKLMPEATITLVNPAVRISTRYAKA